MKTIKIITKHLFIFSIGVILIGTLPLLIDKYSGKYIYNIETKTPLDVVAAWAAGAITMIFLIAFIGFAYLIGFLINLFFYKTDKES